MESKKINQLATNVAPQTSDLTIIGDPITGVSKKITLLQIADLFATTGTVTSVAVTETGDALTISGSPITTAGTINIGFAGDATQYVRGDGALADFPTSTGGGSSVSYYLNSSVSQGTIGGVAYRELSKDPISGAGTDITISSNGYVASYITDANDPSLLEVPGGNFNCEFYFSVNSNAHNPSVYAELYKYDGTTFTLLGSSQSVPEYLTNGTTLSPYYFAIPVATAALTITDRLAIRIYVNVDTRVVTLHTENNYLCQVVTTFSKGLTSLNNLTRQVQFLATGTSGTDFAISSSTATHTFNLPVASAANTGKLSSTDWSTFNGKQAALSFTAPLINTSNTISIPVATASVDGYLDNADWTIFNNKQNAITLTTTGTSGAATLIGATLNIPNYSTALSGYVPYTGATANVDLGIYNMSAAYYKSTNGYVMGQGSTVGLSGSFTVIGATPTSLNIVISNTKVFLLTFPSTSRTYTYPDADGTIALTTDLSSYLPLTGGTLSGKLTINTGGTDNQLQIIGTAPSLRMTNAISGATINGFIAMAGATNNYITGAVSGDMCIGNQNDGKILFGFGAGAATAKVTIANTGAATFSSSVQATNIGIGFAPQSNIGAYVYKNSATDFAFVAQQDGAGPIAQFSGSGGAVRMYIASGGNVGIGSATTNLSGNPLNLTIMAQSTDSGGVLELASSNLTNTTGELGKIEFLGLNGSNTINSRALIVCNQQGTTTSSNMRFFTMTGGTIGERMRILANGNVCIQDSFVDNGAKLCITSGAKAGMRIITDDTYLAISIGGTGNFWMDYPGVGGGRFQVDSNGNTYNRTGVYGTVSSDLRLKENIVDASSKLEDILKLRVVNFNLTNDLDKKKNIGFIAQELKEVFPSFVYESDTREYDEEGNLISGFEDAMGIKVGMEFAILVKAIQELKAEIEILKAK